MADAAAAQASTPQSARSGGGTGREALASLVERVTFHNPDNGFSVLRVKVRGQRDLVTVVGHAATIAAGEFVQASGSWINELTHTSESDFHFVPCDGPEDGVAKVLRLVTERIPQRFGLNPVHDMQVLCPMNRGGLGARCLNLELQRALNPPGELRVERFGWTYAVGDKVMQTENAYEKDVYNGDLGFITRIDPDAAEVVIAFDGREVTCDFGELDAVVPAYATTVQRRRARSTRRWSYRS